MQKRFHPSTIVPTYGAGGVNISLGTLRSQRTQRIYLAKDPHRLTQTWIFLFKSLLWFWTSRWITLRPSWVMSSICPLSGFQRVNLITCGEACSRVIYYYEAPVDPVWWEPKSYRFNPVVRNPLARFNFWSSYLLNFYPSHFRSLKLWTLFVKIIILIILLTLSTQSWMDSILCFFHWTGFTGFWRFFSPAARRDAPGCEISFI